MAGIDWLIDGEGDAWPAHSGGLARRLNTGRSPEILIPYVVENMGWLHARKRGSVAKLWFVPGLVARDALIGAIYWLHDQDVRAVTIANDDRERNTVLPFLRRSQAVKFISGQFDGGQTLGKFRSARLQVTQHNHADKIAAMQAIFKLVRSDTTRHALLEEMFDGFFTLNRLSKKTGDFVIDGLGSGFHRKGPHLNSGLLGKSLTELPDRDFGAWISERYRSICATGNPAADEVEALVTWSGDQRVKYRYSRLSVPAQSRSGDQYVLTVSSNFC